MKQDSSVSALSWEVEESLRRRRSVDAILQLAKVRPRESASPGFSTWVGSILNRRGRPRCAVRPWATAGLWLAWWFVRRAARSVRRPRLPWLKSAEPESALEIAWTRIASVTRTRGCTRKHTQGLEPRNLTHCDFDSFCFTFVVGKASDNFLVNYFIESLHGHTHTPFSIFANLQVFLNNDQNKPETNSLAHQTLRVARMGQRNSHTRNFVNGQFFSITRTTIWKILDELHG